MTIRSLTNSTVSNNQKKYTKLATKYTDYPYVTEYVVVAAGGGHPGSSGSNSAEGSGGGGGGGYRSSVVGELSGTDYPAEDALLLTKGTYSITVGVGGTGQGGSSKFAGNLIVSTGGGSGRARNSGGSTGGSGGGGFNSTVNPDISAYNGINGQGTHGWEGSGSTGGAGGGAGGASLGGTVNASRTSAVPGLTTRILGSGYAKTLAAGGAGTNGNGSDGTDGTGNGANGGHFNNGGGTEKSYPSRSGGNGVVFFKVPYAAEVSFSAGTVDGPYWIKDDNTSVQTSNRPGPEYLYHAYRVTSSITVGIDEAV